MMNFDIFENFEFLQQHLQSLNTVQATVESRSAQQRQTRPIHLAPLHLPARRLTRYQQVGNKMNFCEVVFSVLIAV